MTKKKIAGTKNVYELAQERLKVIFNEFDNIYVSFSGGKDSGVLLNMCIDYIRKNNLKVRLGVFHMDYEIQYKMTIDYVDRMLIPIRIFWMYTGYASLSVWLPAPRCINLFGVRGKTAKRIYGFVPCRKRQ